MPTPEQILADFTAKENEKKRLKEHQSSIPPNEIKNEPVTSLNDLPPSKVVPSHPLPGGGVINNPSRGPGNSIEKEPKVDTSAFARPIPTTGPISPQSHIGIRTLHVPPDFMSSMALILKDGGMDSRSQEKSLARIAELIDEYSAKNSPTLPPTNLRADEVVRIQTNRPLVPRTTGLTSPTGNQDNLPDIKHSDK